MNHKISKRSLRPIAVILVIVSLFGLSCKKSNEESKTIYETVAADPNYSFLTAAITKAGLVNALNDDKKEGLTLFAPSNDAFMAAGFNSVADLAKIPDSTLTKILLYHVLGTKIPAAQVPQASNSEVLTLNTQPIYATRTSDNNVFINGVSVVKADIECTNGVIHNINRVLLPATGTIVQTAINNPDLSLLVAAVLRASQGSTDVATVLSGSGPFTVFAPTNQAFINAGFPDVNSINAADPKNSPSALGNKMAAKGSSQPCASASTRNA